LRSTVPSAGKTLREPSGKIYKQEKKTLFVTRCNDVETLGREISQDGHVLYSEVERGDLAEFLVLVAPDRMVYRTR
jgi:hypothetical protein